MVYARTQLGQPGGYIGMNLLSNLRQQWQEDPLLQKIVKNSGYLLSSNVFSIGLSAIQGILCARLLGVVGVGTISAIIVVITTINNFLSFRMNELVVKYYGESLTKNQPERAAAVVKAAAIAESTASILAFFLLLLLAPFCADHFAHDPTTVPLFIFYGTIILANLAFETSTGILQVNGKFRNQAVINLVSSLASAIIITWAFLIHRGILEVLIAYIIGKFILGVGTMVYGFLELRKTLGKGWWKISFSYLPPLRELAAFAFSTNISQTVISLVRNETLWVAYFLTTQAVGYTDTAFTIINLVVLPITPFISTTFPEINRSVVEKNWKRTKDILRKVTFISGTWTIFTGLILIFFGQVLLNIYGSKFIPAYVPMLIYLVGLGFANIFFWNRPLLLSLGLPMVPYRLSLWCGLVKIVLSFLLVPKFGLNFEAFLLSAFFVLSISLIILRGFSEIRKRELEIDGARV
jgi:O-antigen/teichoic acid export membrane protein